MRAPKVHFKLDLPFPIERYCRPTLGARHWSRIVQKVTCLACRTKIRRRR
jgi:hypothetical protein